MKKLIGVFCFCARKFPVAEITVEFTKKQKNKKQKNTHTRGR